ncbi:MAG TPA: hypothetical protein VFJ58_17540 [Armatimonadota bacterium]|nr:hypothetical protein [Armatimonadota bacterium]
MCAIPDAIIILFGLPGTGGILAAAFCIGPARELRQPSQHVERGCGIGANRRPSWLFLRIGGEMGVRDGLKRAFTQGGTNDDDQR